MRDLVQLVLVIALENVGRYLLRISSDPLAKPVLCTFVGGTGPRSLMLP